MVYSQADDARNRALIQFYFDALKRQSKRLFAHRVDILMDFYGNVFDNKPKCIELIAVPSEHPTVKLSLYMAYREARFVLDSDRAECTDLERLWLLLNMLVSGEMDPVALANMCQLNSAARWRVLGCRDKIMDIMPELFSLAETNYTKARLTADALLRDVTQTFDEIIASYSTTQSKPTR